MNTITTKQINFIERLSQKAGKEFNADSVKCITTFEASKIIRQLLKETESTKTTEEPKPQKNYLDYSLKDYQELSAKFNLKLIANAGEGWTGSRHEEFSKLGNGTKQRIYLSNIIKSALPGLTFKVSCSKGRYIRIEAEEATEEAKEFLQNLLNSVNWCNGDYYGDYGAYYSYYDHLTVNKLIEPETLKAEKETKRIKEAGEAAAKYAAEQVQRETEETARVEQWAKDKKYLLDHVVVHTQAAKYFKNVFEPSNNKQCTFDEYKEQTDGYNRTVKVCKVIDILDNKALDILKNNLMADIPELYGNDKENGGSLLIWSDSLMPVEDADYPQGVRMDDSEALKRCGMEWATCAILIKCDGNNIMFIDTEGYSYARYVLIQHHPMMNGSDEFGYSPDETIKHTTDQTKVLTTDEFETVEGIKENLKLINGGNTMTIYNFKSKSDYSENLLNALKEICDYSIKDGVCITFKNKAAA